jgi:FAD/FMN-containing dehydrogenase
MDTIQFDAGSGRIRIGGGVVNQPLFSALQDAGVAFTHGRCQNVGVAGFVLGGGIGFNMRAHGIACDQLVETRIVMASGRILTGPPRCGRPTRARRRAAR